MTQQKLLQHINEMRERLSQTASTEQSLVKDLADGLKNLDQQLLQDVRKVAAEHQTRRAVILNELEALASSVGMFQPPREALSPQQIPQQTDYGHQYAATAGDWRQATKNVSFQDEFERHLNGRTPH
jgi:cell division septum initiation protein DivIVA